MATNPKQLEQKLSDPVASTAETDPRLKALGEGITHAVETPVPSPPDVIKMPEMPSSPHIDEPEWQGLGMSLVAMAMIAGASRGGWMTAGHFLNGALQGYRRGQDELAKENFAKYQEQVKVTMEQQKTRNEQYKELLSSRDRSINEMIAEYRVMSAEDGRKDQLQAAQTRSLVAMEGAIMRNEMAMERLQLQISNAHGSLQGPQDLQQVGDTGAWIYYVGGKAPPLPFGKSPERAAFERGIENVRKILGMSQPEFAANVGTNAATAHAITKMKDRSVQIEAAESAALKNMDLTVESAKKVGLSDFPLLNKAIIAGKYQSGSPAVIDYQTKLDTALREYKKVSMGNIGASGLTDTQIRQMEKRISDANSVDQLVAAKNAMAQDMAAVTSSFQEQANGLKIMASQIDQQRGVQESAGAVQPAPAEKVVNFEDWAKGKQ